MRKIVVQHFALHVHGAVYQSAKARIIARRPVGSQDHAHPDLSTLPTLHYTPTN